MRLLIWIAELIDWILSLFKGEKNQGSGHADGDGKGAS